MAVNGLPDPLPFLIICTPGYDGQSGTALGESLVELEGVGRLEIMLLSLHVIVPPFLFVMDRRIDTYQVMS